MRILLKIDTCRSVCKKTKYYKLEYEVVLQSRKMYLIESYCKWPMYNSLGFFFLLFYIFFFFSKVWSWIQINKNWQDNIHFSPWNLTLSKERKFTKEHIIIIEFIFIFWKKSFFVLIKQSNSII